MKNRKRLRQERVMAAEVVKSNWIQMKQEEFSA